MKIKVNIHEFTYKDKGKYHIVVSQGEVPEANSEVQKALKKGIITKFGPEKDSNTKSDKK
jgi:hypothetical protein